MSWAITINDLQSFDGFDLQTTEQMLTHHIKYPDDMHSALKLAKETGLKSGTLAGSRTVSPYTQDEVVVITVTGFSNATDFNAEMKRIVTQPANNGAIPSDAENERLFFNRLQEQEYDDG